MKFETHKDFLDSISTHEIKVRIDGVGEGMLLDRFGVEMIAAANGGKQKDETPHEEAARRLYISKADGKTPILPKENLTACLINAGKFMKDGRYMMTTSTGTRVTGVMEILEPEIKIISGPGSPKEGWRALVAGISVAKGGRQAKSRPCWDTWSLEFTIYLMPDPENSSQPLINPDRMRTLLEIAGSRVGLGCWNIVHSGYHGRFVVSQWKPKRIQKKKAA